MSRGEAARRLRKSQAKAAQDRLDAYNETVSGLREMMTELGNFDDVPSMQELLVIFGTALVQSNLATAQMMAACQAEQSLTAIMVTSPRTVGEPADDDPDENEARLEDELAAWRRRQELVVEATAQARMWRDEALAGGLTNGVEDLLDRLIAEVEAVDRA